VEEEACYRRGSSRAPAVGGAVRKAVYAQGRKRTWGDSTYRDRTMNMTNWHSVAATVDDTTAVLDSCSLKYRRRAYFTAYVKEEKRELRTKARTFASSLS
jgi:hypothetical protein